MAFAIGPWLPMHKLIIDDGAMVKPLRKQTRERFAQYGDELPFRKTLPSRLEQAMCPQMRVELSDIASGER